MSGIYQDEENTWYLSSYPAVKLLLSDPRFVRSPPQGKGFIDKKSSQTKFDKIIANWALFTDPPHHTKLRSVLSILLDPTFIKQTKILIESITDSLLKEILAMPQVDFMKNFASRLPIKILKSLIGLTEKEEIIRNWSIPIAKAIDHGTPEDFLQVTPILEEIEAHILQIIAKRKLSPGKDWISLLLEYTQQHNLSQEEMVSSCILLLVAGQETVQLTLGLGLKTLLQHPTQLTQLQQFPKLIPSAIEEMLRFCSPVKKLSRWTSQEMYFEESNITIGKNELVVGLIQQANFDPTKFEKPHEFNVSRHNNRHLTFGFGVHQCVGALLARLELQIAFSKLIPYLTHFTLIEEEVKWLDNSSFNYLYQLPIKINI